MSDFSNTLNEVYEYNFGNNKSCSSIYNSSNNSGGGITYYNASDAGHIGSSSHYNVSKGYMVINANSIPLWFSQKHCGTR
jgi:hypothetical protein